MRTLFMMIVGALLYWGYQENVHEDLKSMYENKNNASEVDRHLNVIDAKASVLFNDLFSGCNVSKKNFDIHLDTPLDLSDHVKSITKHAGTHNEKIKAIYQWITSHIAYDTDYNIYSADMCYLEGKGVCNAYSHLMVKMLDCVGIRAIKVNGKARSSASDSWEGHAWVLAEKANGEYMICDPTWDAGWVDPETGKFHSHPAMEWFDVSPKEMIRSHVPDYDRHRLM